MSKTDSDLLSPSPRPALEDEDFESPFLHETSSAFMVVMVLAAVLVTFIVVGFALYLA